MISLLAAGLVPADMVKPEDFSSEDHRRLAQALVSGVSVNAYISGIEDAAQRERAMSAINYSPLPDDHDEAVKMADNCLKNLRRSRIQARIEDIKQRVAAASAEQKNELYRQMTALMKELDD